MVVARWYAWALLALAVLAALSVPFLLLSGNTGGDLLVCVLVAVIGLPLAYVVLKFTKGKE